MLLRRENNNHNQRCFSAWKKIDALNGQMNYVFPTGFSKEAFTEEENCVYLITTEEQSFVKPWNTYTDV